MKQKSPNFVVQSYAEGRFDREPSSKLELDSTSFHRCTLRSSIIYHSSNETSGEQENGAVEPIRSLELCTIALKFTSVEDFRRT